MNILVPIAGRDKYFPEGDYVFPKPLIDIAGSPLIEHTLKCLMSLSPRAHFTFVVQEEDCRRFSLDNVLKVITPDRRADVVRLRAPTQGAVCSCLMAIGHLEPNEELVIANSDQVILSNLADIIEGFRAKRLDGAVITFDSTHPRFSYIRTDEAGLITETEEKQVISRLGIAGFYYFRRASEFIESAKRVLLNDNPFQGSFFISQVLNEMILAGKHLSHHQIASQAYFPLYSPQKIVEYEEALFADRTSASPAATRPTLVVPMAGDGSRFAQAGYTLPKPFIDVCGKPMIWRVLENLNYAASDVVLVVQRAHLEAEPKHAHALIENHGFRLVKVDKRTEGAACTILLARREIDRSAPLIIANCDQIVDFDCREFVKDCLDRKLDGSILVFREPARSTKWSYARTGDDGLVVEVKEKVAISDLATVGIYFFAKGAFFIDAAVDMIARNDRVNNEFYTCPVYNYMIAQGQKVGIFEIAKTAMHGLGVPEDLENYLKHLRQTKVRSR